ncbi:MAG: hypothetical protein IKB70_08555 [Bacilli bacterium]|nr:hypothetical protein [Bacilli bacterium]
MTSLKGLIGLIGPWVAGVAAIATAIWVASEAWVAHEKAAQKAALAAQEASDRYAEAKSSFESFKT